MVGFPSGLHPKNPAVDWSDPIIEELRREMDECVGRMGDPVHKAALVDVLRILDARLRRIEDRLPPLLR